MGIYSVTNYFLLFIILQQPFFVTNVTEIILKFLYNKENIVK